MYKLPKVDNKEAIPINKECYNNYKTAIGVHYSTDFSCENKC